MALVAAVLMTGTTEPPEVGEQAPSFSLSDASGNQVALQDVLTGNQQVALIFYRGYGRGICRAQLVELQDNYDEFRERGVELVALSMDDVSGAAAMAEHADAEFPILADPRGRAVRDYALYNLLKDGVSAPAVFILDSAGTVQYSYIGEHAGDRPHAPELLSIIDAISGS